MKKNSHYRYGFSLIEVMVATVLLMVIVGMVGLVFRQNTLMWNSGMRRAEGMGLVRMALGTIERDLRNAVDGSKYKEWNAGNGSDAQPSIYVEKYVLAFVAFLGDGDDSELVRITYNANDNGSLTRTVEPLYWDSSSLNTEQWRWKPASKEDGVLIEEMKPATSMDGPQKPQVEISFEKESGSTTTANPRYVTIKAELLSSEDFASVRVKSLGDTPERENTHIIVW